MKILIIKYRNIGDVLLSTPLLSNLKYFYPDSKIDFALNKETCDILKNNINIDNVFPHDRKLISNYSFFKKIYIEIKQLFFFRNQKYDIVINLTEGDRGALIAIFSGAKKKYSFKPRKGLLSYLKLFDDYGEESDNIHTVDRDLQFLKFLGLQVHYRNVDIFWSEQDEDKVNSLLEEYSVEQYIHIHPVSRWMYKCWEDNRMAKLIDFISKESDFKVVLTGSPSEIEKEHIRLILEQCDSSPINLSGFLTLNQLAYLSSLSKLFFGVDTAPMHIAAAVGTKVFAIFGASSPVIWGPWDNESGSSYQDLIGIQKNGHHKIFSHTDRTIFFDGYIKKTKGMVSIKSDEVILEITKDL